VCGTGNNGGDGIAAARILHQQGYAAAVTVVGEPEKMTEETKKQLEMAVGCQVPVLPVSAIIEGQFDIFLDGLFGIGLSRDVEGIYEQIIENMNESGALIYALDVPSGIHAGTGAVLGMAVRAACTITFGVNKAGLVLYPGCEYAGEVFVGDIGFPAESVASAVPAAELYEPSDIPGLLPARPAHSHKGTFGRVLVAAGSETMSGACYLAAKAAYAMGAGLVRVVSTGNNREILLSSLPEILFSEREEIADVLDWADAIVLGPGLGLAKEAEELVRYVVENSPVPTVIDGDGIRLCRNITNTLTDNFILTPHVKEMSYLTGKSVSELGQDILGTTREAASEWGCIIAQKDARTAVSDGGECYLNVSGNNGMATGGSGDVLAGMIGGLLGQQLEPFAAAKLGVYLHGLAGDAMAEEKSVYSLMASDIITGISRVLGNQGGRQ
ncbi:MAG: NAD(P)H-hydrate dehydratase, partial [Lachnospiraceae bacterium]|nr:NAD(P)H-hydrate dehydratase [Lachnospiraceae bacterium]